MDEIFKTVVPVFVIVNDFVELSPTSTSPNDRELVLKFNTGFSGSGLPVPLSLIVCVLLLVALEDTIVRVSS